MPSSTSSSEARLWRSTWLITLAICVLALGGWEVHWRTRGFEPSINSDANLWAVERGRVQRSGPASVILVGSSRIQLGIEPDAFSQGSGWSRPHQLGIPMAPSIPILEDLAGDPSVAALIVCEINPFLYFDSKHRFVRVAERHLERRAGFTPADEVEARLRTLTQRTLVSSLAALSPKQIMLAIEAREWPKPSFARFDASRFGKADARRLDLSAEAMRSREQRLKTWTGKPADQAEIQRTTEGVNRLVAQMRAKGGDVIFVRLPVDGAVRVREARFTPRAKFWDRFASQVDAVTIHYADHPQLTGFSPPDGSHLDQGEIAEFSFALGEILAREHATR